MNDLTELTITQARAKLDAREISALALARAYRARIDEHNARLNAYLEVFDDIEDQAQAADARLARGESQPLLGIPIALKDNMLLAGRRVGAASKILEGYVAPYDATALAKLKAHGAVFLGRTNCDEFAMGSSTENSAYGVTKNPVDESRVAGGSSGGSAAVVAARLAAAALGSDTGGSIRQPASFCGTIGLKPTYGSVSRHGLIAMGSSLDVIGPFTKTIEDAELIYDAIKGRDEMDSTTLEVPEANGTNAVKTIGVPRAFLSGCSEQVLETFEAALERLRGLGYAVKDIELPLAPKALAMYYIIMPAEVSSNLARYDGMRYGLHVEGDDLLGDYLKTRGEGFGAEAQRRILLGTYVLSSGYYDAYYKQAMHARYALMREFAAAFKEVDVIATPTAPSAAFAIGEKSDPLSMYLADMFTVPANLAGIPGVSIPMNETSTFSPANLPMGMQFLAPHACDARLFALGTRFQ